MKNIGRKVRIGNYKPRFLIDNSSLLVLVFILWHYNYSWSINSAAILDVSRISSNIICDNSGYGRLNCRRQNINNILKSIWNWCLLPYFIGVWCAKIVCRIFSRFNSSWIVYGFSIHADNVTDQSVWCTVIAVNYMSFCFNRECYYNFT